MRALFEYTSKFIREQHLRRLGAGGITGADEQDVGLPETVLPGHNASPCGANSCA